MTINHLNFSEIEEIWGAIDELIGIQTKEGEIYFTQDLTSTPHGVDGLMWQKEE